MAKRSTDPFVSPKLLLARAEEHIQSLHHDWGHFHERCFGIPFEVFDAEKSQRVLKFRICPDVPPRLSVLASDALNNLRHALDQAVNCAAAELGSTKRNNYFPFAKSASELDGLIKKNCPTVQPELLATLKGFQPYQGGDDVLYALAKLAGPNKHQLLLDLQPHMPSLVIDTRFGGWFRRVAGPGTMGILAWDSEKQELEAARVWGSGSFQYDYMTRPAFYVAIGGTDASRGQPAAAFLDAVASKVDGIVRVLEAETVRLKSA